MTHAFVLLPYCRPLLSGTGVVRFKDAKFQGVHGALLAGSSSSILLWLWCTLDLSGVNSFGLHLSYLAMDCLQDDGEELLPIVNNTSLKGEAAFAVRNTYAKARAGLAPYCSGHLLGSALVLDTAFGALDENLMLPEWLLWSVP